MSEQDTFPANKPDSPRDMTPDELEEALRWLEDLAGKQGKNLDGLVTLEDASLEDSPFKGLFDSDEQELPDWLREVPSLIDDEGEIQEGESALDWLARMAKREESDELPTLEWRRLTEEEDADDVVEALPATAAAIAGLPSLALDEDEAATTETAEPDAATETLPNTAIPTEPDAPAVVDLMKAMAVADAAGAAAPEDMPVEGELVADEPEADTEPGQMIMAEAFDTAIPQEADLSTVAEEPSEALLAELQAGLSEAGVAPDDLDDAMAWLEELAASQDAPIEDLPSVADRALASKLIADAASGRSTIEGVDVSQLGIALSGIYVGETKLAPEGPLVGQGPVDETPDSALHAEMALALEPDDVTAAPDALMAGDRTYDDLMPHEEAPTEPDGPSPTEELVTWTALEPAEVDLTSSDEPAATDATLADLMAQPAEPPKTLAEHLAEVDRLAVPAGTSLSEIMSLLDADLTLVKVTPFSLESTLAWLEGGPNGAPADPLDAGLVAAMPEDPDEAQAWLEQLAGEPDAAVSASAPAIAEAFEALDLTEADLLDMPEDPDAAIAWIESLAARREQSNP